MIIYQLVLLQKVIDYIEEHIKDKINPKELAEMVGYSPYHFYRVFEKHTGYTVMNYVLKRKLQYALHDLVNGKKVTQIAFDYGFETHAGFTKAFKRCFGSPPSLYKTHCPTSLPQKFDLLTLQEKKVGGIVLQPKMVTRHAFWVAGKAFKSHLKDVSYTRDAPAFWDQEGLNDGSVETMLYELLAPQQHGEYCINLGPEQEYFTYLFAVHLDKDVKLPSELFKFEIPTTTYAVFKTPLVELEQFVPAIRGTWQYILEDWLPYSAYEVDENSYDFEYYDEYCHHWEYEKIYMEIHLPVKEKTRK